MRIAHIGIYTTDLERMKEYYIKYFGAKCGEKYVNTKGFSSYFLTLDDEARIEIMAHKELVTRPVMDKTNGYAHMAISVGSKEKVVSLTEQLVKDGYELYSAPRTTGDGYFESVVADPDGNRVEITE